MSKEQRKFERMLAAGNKDASEGSARVIGHYEYDFKAGTEKFTPLNSEEGEQPMKEEIDMIQLHEEWRKTDDLNFFDWLKQHGYTLTKK